MRVRVRVRVRVRTSSALGHSIPPSALGRLPPPHSPVAFPRGRIPSLRLPPCRCVDADGSLELRCEALGDGGDGGDAAPPHLLASKRVAARR